MVCPDSHRIPRVPWYLGTLSRRPVVFRTTGLSPSVAGLSRAVRLDAGFVTPAAFGRRPREAPRHRVGNACRLSRRRGLGFPLFARHYSGDVLFSCGYLDVSVPRVPSAPPIYSARSTWTLLQVGCPIRKSSDRTLASSYPRLIAAMLRPSSALGAKASTVRS